MTWNNGSGPNDAARTVAMIGMSALVASRTGMVGRVRECSKDKNSLVHLSSEASFCANSQLSESSIARSSLTQKWLFVYSEGTMSNLVFGQARPVDIFAVPSTPLGAKGLLSVICYATATESRLV